MEQSVHINDFYIFAMLAALYVKKNLARALVQKVPYFRTTFDLILAPKVPRPWPSGRKLLVQHFKFALQQMFDRLATSKNIAIQQRCYC